MLRWSRRWSTVAGYFSGKGTVLITEGPHPVLRATIRQGSMLDPWGATEDLNPHDRRLRASGHPRERMAQVTRKLNGKRENWDKKRTPRSWSNAAHSAMWCNVITSPVTETSGPPLGFNKSNEGLGLSNGLSYDSSHEFEPLEPPLGYDKSINRASLRCGCRHVSSTEAKPLEPSLGHSNLFVEAEDTAWTCPILAKMGLIETAAQE
ncbi:hypothetical protein V6N11_060605 [Hibiscus sabdariffa]|uniref:Uncharacterized protein n=1 Tax=Hibiscus sabdariffa TaxID=183260 RepID=A0ABR2QQZ6_9ROSI